MESNHAKRGYPKVIPLMPLEEKLKCRNVEADLRYHQPSSNREKKSLLTISCSPSIHFDTNLFRKTPRTWSFGCNQQKQDYDESIQ